MKPEHFLEYNFLLFLLGITILVTPNGGIISNSCMPLKK
jgi:hypothetical protein